MHPLLRRRIPLLLSFAFAFVVRAVRISLQNCWPSIFHSGLPDKAVSGNVAIFSAFVAAPLSTAFVSFSTSVLVKESSFCVWSFSIIPFAFAFAEFSFSFAAFDNRNYRPGNFSSNARGPSLLSAILLLLLLVVSFDGPLCISLAG